jgi:pimeloyl-ACP methyl ester carboxylesterase
VVEAEIRSLARALAVAEATVRDRFRDADLAARLATDFIATASTDPAAAVETDRLRRLAVQSRLQAQNAQREADVIRQRSVARSTSLVLSLARHDARVAADIDALLTLPPPQTAIAKSVDVIAAPPPPDDRARLVRQINETTRAIRDHVEALDAAIAQLGAVDWEERTWFESIALDQLTDELALHRSFLEPGRQILAWDPTGDGRVVEAFGDLATANHIAVVVPGIMNTIRNFDDMHSPNSRNLWSAASEIDPDVAVIAWLGYDTPELLNAASKERAVEYEAELRDFVKTLPADAHVSVLAHSYGTVLSGEAAVRGLVVDDLVMVGSPGTRLHGVGDAQLEPGAQIWAGVSDTDWVVGRTGLGSVVCPETIIGAGWLAPLRWVTNPITVPLSFITDSCQTDADGDVKGLSHGVNPAHEDFGAIEISTDGVGGHSDYFDAETSSLDAMARIITGTHPDQR